MAVREVLLYPDPRLKSPCHIVAEADGACDALIQDLVDTMYGAGHSVGVAAPQIGVLQRVAVVDVSASRQGRHNHHGLLTMINPTILQRSGTMTLREGCMSVPDYTGNVARAEEILVQFLDRNGRPRAIRCRGFEAVAVQHELDHLDGRLFLDRITSLKTDLFRRKRP